MEPLSAKTGSAWETLSDEEIVRRVVAGERALFELLMRRHNARVYRTVRSLIRDEAEVEDVMQAAYLSAYAHLRDFHHTARFSTWLTRVAFNEGLMRLRKTKRLVAYPDMEEAPMTDSERPPTPEDNAAQTELMGMLERAVDELPDIYRTVFVLRDVEGLSTADAAEALETSEDVVKTRLVRARAALRARLVQEVSRSAESIFPFHAPRCDRVVRNVMAAIAGETSER